MIEGILVGIFSNSIFSFIQNANEKVDKQNDNDLVQRIHNVLEKTTKDFFSKYSKLYPNPETTFIAKESNIEIIIDYFHFGKEINLKMSLDPKGIDGKTYIKNQHLDYFIQRLENNINEDYRLSKIKATKEHYVDSQEAFSDIKDIKRLLGLGYDKSTEKESSWEFKDAVTGEKIEHKEGEKHHLKYPNGAEQIFMVNGDIISVDIKGMNDKWAYYEMDMKTGAIIDNKFPYPLSEYNLVLVESEILNKNTMKNINGSRREIIKMKWGRRIEVVYNSKGKILGFDGKGGWSVNHIKKTIEPSN